MSKKERVWSFLLEKWYYKTDIVLEASAWSTNKIGKDERAGRDARSISILLKLRKKGPRPAVKSPQEISLDGVCEFVHASLLERTLILSRGEKNVACVSRRVGTALLSEF